MWCGLALKLGTIMGVGQYVLIQSELDADFFGNERNHGSGREMANKAAGRIFYAGAGIADGESHFRRSILAHPH